jgi:hypothetical protein
MVVKLKVVYHCYGGAHASPTAAALHLGLLPLDRSPQFQEFHRLIPYYDRITRGEHGKLIKIGTDGNGHEVFVLGRRNAARPVINAIKEFSRLCGVDPHQYYFVDVVQLSNPFMVAGGFVSRALGYVQLGRPLVSFGTGLSYRNLVRLVRRTLADLEGKPV